MPRRVAVVGGGIIGLEIARSRLKAGDAVTVIDSAAPGAASAASAGMLTIHHMDPWLDEELLGLMRRSRDLWRQLAKELTDIDYRDHGILSLALDDDDIAALRHCFQGERRYLAAEQVAELEPTLAAAVGGTITEEATVDVPLTLTALGRAIGGFGGELVTDSVTELKFGGDKITAAIGKRGQYRADEFVFATGAWQPPGLNKLAKHSAPPLPLHPIKGQMLCFRPPPGGEPMPLKHSLWVKGYYLVVRADRLLFGASVEERGFDHGNTAEHVAEMLRIALETLPNLRHWRFSCWGGLRPTSIDGLPIIGRVAANGTVAVGHYRNGILLAPATAELVSNILDGGEEVAAFSPKRFTEEKSHANIGERQATSVG